MAKAIVWNENGWNAIQEADGEKHILGVNCRTENGMVVEVKVRHRDSEEVKATALYEGKNALPMSIKEFSKLFAKKKIEFKE